MTAYPEFRTPTEAPYLGGSVTNVPAYEESIWFCPDCLVNGVENKLLYVAATKALACPCCSAEYANDAELAQAYYEAMGALMGEKAHAEKQTMIAEAKLAEVRKCGRWRHEIYQQERKDRG